MIVQWAPAVYVLTLLVVALCLYRGHRDEHINLWDCIRAGKDGQTFTDPRKLYEAGAFVVMTIGFAYLTLLDKMTEVYAAIYVGAWVAARSLRDREQRLNRALDTQPTDARAPQPPDATSSAAAKFGFVR